MRLTDLLTDKTKKWFEEKLDVKDVRMYINSYNGRPKYYNFFSTKLDFSFGLYKKKGEWTYAIGFIRNTTEAKDDNVRMIVEKLIQGELMRRITSEES